MGKFPSQYSDSKITKGNPRKYIDSLSLRHQIQSCQSIAGTMTRQTESSPSVKLTQQKYWQQHKIYNKTSNPDVKILHIQETAMTVQTRNYKIITSALDTESSSTSRPFYQHYLHELNKCTKNNPMTKSPIHAKVTLKQHYEHTNFFTKSSKSDRHIKETTMVPQQRKFSQTIMSIENSKYTNQQCDDRNIKDTTMSSQPQKFSQKIMRIENSKSIHTTIASNQQCKQKDSNSKPSNSVTSDLKINKTIVSTHPQKYSQTIISIENTTSSLHATLASNQHCKQKQFYTKTSSSVISDLHTNEQPSKYQQATMKIRNTQSVSHSTVPFRKQNDFSFKDSRTNCSELRVEGTPMTLKQQKPKKVRNSKSTRPTTVPSNQYREQKNFSANPSKTNFSDLQVKGTKMTQQPRNYHQATMARRNTKLSTSTDVPISHHWAEKYYYTNASNSNLNDLYVSGRLSTLQSRKYRLATMTGKNTTSSTPRARPLKQQREHNLHSKASKTNFSDLHLTGRTVNLQPRKYTKSTIPTLVQPYKEQEDYHSKDSNTNLSDLRLTGRTVTLQPKKNRQTTSKVRKTKSSSPKSVPLNKEQKYLSSKGSNTNFSNLQVKGTSITLQPRKFRQVTKAKRNTKSSTPTTIAFNQHWTDKYFYSNASNTNLSNLYISGRISTIKPKKYRQANMKAENTKSFTRTALSLSQHKKQEDFNTNASKTNLSDLYLIGKPVTLQPRKYQVPTKKKEWNKLFSHTAVSLNQQKEQEDVNSKPSNTNLSDVHVIGRTVTLQPRPRKYHQATTRVNNTESSIPTAVSLNKHREQKDYHYKSSNTDISDLHIKGSRMTLQPRNTIASRPTSVPLNHHRKPKDLSSKDTNLSDQHLTGRTFTREPKRYRQTSTKASPRKMVPSNQHWAQKYFHTKDSNSDFCDLHVTGTAITLQPKKFHPRNTKSSTLTTVPVNEYRQKEFRKATTSVRNNKSPARKLVSSNQHWAQQYFSPKDSNTYFCDLNVSGIALQPSKYHPDNTRVEHTKPLTPKTESQPREQKHFNSKASSTDLSDFYVTGRNITPQSKRVRNYKSPIRKAVPVYQQRQQKDLYSKSSSTDISDMYVTAERTNTPQYRQATTKVRNNKSSTSRTVPKNRHRKQEEFNSASNSNLSDFHKTGRTFTIQPRKYRQASTRVKHIKSRIAAMVPLDQHRIHKDLYSKYSNTNLSNVQVKGTAMNPQSRKYGQATTKVKKVKSRVPMIVPLNQLEQKDSHSKTSNSDVSDLQVTQISVTVQPKKHRQASRQARNIKSSTSTAEQLHQNRKQKEFYFKGDSTNQQIKGTEMTVQPRKCRPTSMRIRNNKSSATKVVSLTEHWVQQHFYSKGNLTDLNDPYVNETMVLQPRQYRQTTTPRVVRLNQETEQKHFYSKDNNTNICDQHLKGTIMTLKPRQCCRTTMKVRNAKASTPKMISLNDRWTRKQFHSKDNSSDHGDFYVNKNKMTKQYRQVTLIVRNTKLSSPKMMSLNDRWSQNHSYSEASITGFNERKITLQSKKCRKDNRRVRKNKSSAPKMTLNQRWVQKQLHSMSTTDFSDIHGTTTTLQHRKCNHANMKTKNTKLFRLNQRWGQKQCYSEGSTTDFSDHCLTGRNNRQPIKYRPAKKEQKDYYSESELSDFRVSEKTMTIQPNKNRQITMRIKDVKYGKPRH